MCVSFHLVSSSSPHLFRMFVFLPLLALWMSLTFPPFSFSNESALYFRFFPTVFFFPFRCSDFRVCVYVCVFFLSEYSLSQHPSCVGLCFFFHFLNVLPSTSHIYIYIYLCVPPSPFLTVYRAVIRCAFFIMLFFLSLLSRFLFSPLPPTRLCLFALWWYHVIAIYASIFSLDACVCCCACLRKSSFPLLDSVLVSLFLS